MLVIACGVPGKDGLGRLCPPGKDGLGWLCPLRDGSWMGCGGTPCRVPRLFPRAAKAKAASPSFTNFEAWVAAIRRTQQHERTRASHPAQNIKAVVARLGCWSSSSSTVERSFEETSGLRGGQSEDEFVNREGDILIIKKDPLLDKDRIQFTIAFHHLKASTSVKHHESNANIKMYESNV